jgi:hypothetical protein
MVRIERRLLFYLDNDRAKVRQISKSVLNLSNRHRASLTLVPIPTRNKIKIYKTATVPLSIRTTGFLDSHSVVSKTYTERH